MSHPRCSNQVGHSNVPPPNVKPLYCFAVRYKALFQSIANLEETNSANVADISSKDETISTLQAKIEKFDQSKRFEYFSQHHFLTISRSLEIINTDNKNAYTALEANLKKVEGERDLANQSFSKIKEERSQLSSELKVKWDAFLQWFQKLYFLEIERAK